MRYYKQFHKWRFTPVLPLVAGLALVLAATFSETDIDARLIFFACGTVFIVGGWVVRKGQKHYIEIDDEKIVHRGFRQWTVLKSEVISVERGRKGWLDDRELYLRIHVQEKSYDVDDGFLTDEKHVQELAKAIGSR